MDAIVAAYGSSSSESGDESAHDDEAPAADLSSGEAEASPASSGLVGGKRKRETDAPPQWKRAFPHVDGQWPSHVKISIAVDGPLRERVSTLVASVQEEMGDAAELVPMLQESEASDGTPELHMSLSRPFVLTYDQIAPFVNELRGALKWRKRFSIELGDALVLVNDEKTRAFLALRVEQGHAAFVQTLKCVDRCMEKFQLEPYYKNPVPHVSVASAIGDALAECLSHEQLRQLNAQQTLPRWRTAITKVHAVIGNKQFEVCLS